MKDGTVLGPLLESLCREKLPNAGRLSGQRILVKRKDCSAWICVDDRDSVHFLLAPAPADSARFLRFKMRLLTFGVQEWIISREKAGRYIDVTCRANRKSAMRRPFLGFCDDALVELAKPGNSPDDALFRTALRWHRFWTAEETESVSRDWLLGIFGELTLLKSLVKTFGPEALNSWSGPEGHDQDFQGNGVGLEVKATSTQPPVLQISNLNQLDPSLFNSLFVVVYSVTAAKTGMTLPDLVGDIEQLLGNDLSHCDLFWRKLRAAGYLRHMEELYRELRFSIDRKTAFAVNDSFPKLTSKSLCRPLDSRIKEVRYSIRLTGVTGMDCKMKKFEEVLSKLCASSGQGRQD